jgi:hypothetical protein
MNIIVNAKQHSQLPPQPNASRSPIPRRESLTTLLIGSPEAIRTAIHDLHQRGYAEAGDWSGLLPAPDPSEVMSILIRHRLVSDR